MALTIILVMLVLLLLGYPMIVPMLVATFVGFFVYFPMLKSDIIVQQMISGISPVALITVPMFILAADIVTRGHTANRLLDLAMTFFGHIKGGLAVTTAVACTLFGAISGSTQATVVAIGGPIRPRMLQAGYDDRFTTALIINASDIAFLIPPSIGMIVFGIVGKVSIGELFLAGIGPGLLILVLFSIYSVWYAWRNNIPLAPRIGWADRLRASRKASLALMFPVLIIGGLYAGYFSPTEVAAIAVLYAFAEGTFSNWAVIYLREAKDLSAVVAALALSVFWGAMVVGRLLVAVLVVRIAPLTIWLALPALMIAAFLLLPGASTPVLGLGLFALAGLACSAFFPLTITLASERFPEHVAWVSSMLIAALMVGVGLGSFVIGPLREWLSLEQIYQFSVAYPVAVIGLALWLAGSRRRLAVEIQV